MRVMFYRFVVLTLLSLFLYKFLNYILNYDTLYSSVLSEQLTQQQINYYLDLKTRWRFIEFLVVPLILFIKTIIISSVIYVSTFFLSLKNLNFKVIWSLVLKAEFLFLLIPITKLIWFYFFQTNFAFEDLQYFYPLSALNIVGYKGVEPWFIYPLQTLNLFELAYWFLLAYQIGKIATPYNTVAENKYPTEFGLKIVASSYGVGLLLWVCVVMFLTLNYS